MKNSSVVEKIQIWSAATSEFISDINTLYALLSEDERVRVRRFYFRRDADRYVVARGNLRVLLGCYCMADPARIRFAYGPYGRPYMLTERTSEHIYFNLSHSENLVLYAFSRNCMQIGIDVELQRPLQGLEQMAARLFTVREYSEFARVDSSRKEAAFFQYWTRKEALAKATGQGLTFDIERLDVSLTPGAPTRLMSFSGDVEETARWTLLSLEPAVGFHAALAIRAPSVDVQCLAVPSRYCRGLIKRSAH
jgi:4'-phosphopantetheinyl transferase